MVAPSKPFNYAKDITVEDLGRGISRQILAYENSLLVARIWFEAGSEGYAHSHPHAQITHVLSGKFLVTVDGLEQTLSAGDSYYAASGLIHGMTCVEKGSVIDSFSPVREDFLSPV